MKQSNGVTGNRQFAPAKMSLVAMAVLILSSPAIARAQTPVPLVHGFNENFLIWNDVTNGLSGFNITPVPVALNSHDYIPNQATSMLGQLSPFALNNAIVIGHSNGGLVSREAAKSKVFRGLFTFGTPNNGAPIAISYPSYLNFVSGWLASAVWTATAVDESLWYEMDWSWSTVAWYATFFIINNIGWPALLDAGLGGFFPPEPIVQGTDPAGAYINYLNSSGNLAVEASHVTERVGIVVATDASSTGGPLRVMLDWPPLVLNGLAWSIEVVAWTGYVLGSDLYWDTVNNYWQYDDFYYARLSMGGSLQDLAWYFMEYDTYWCYAIQNAYLPCGPSDGFIPVANQAYAGATYALVNADKAHPFEQHDPEVITEIGIRLAAILGPPDPPPPPPLTASISGPSDVQPFDSMCSWWAAPSGGIPPYSYQWSGFAWGTGQGVWGAPSGSAWLYLEVTDAYGSHAYAEAGVNAYWEAPACQG